MSIQLISVSYQYAPLKIREKFAFTKDEQKQMMEQLVQEKEIEECVLIATCNRTELYCYGNDAFEERKIFALMQEHLLKKAGIEREDNSYLRFYQNRKVSHHLFWLATGLDSMVIGEDQILGQVKDAHELAMELGTTGVYLNTLFRYAVTGAKKVKTETNLSKTSVSTASLSVKAAVQEFGSLAGKKVMIIGASGKIGSIVLKNLACINGVQIFATTRRNTLGHLGVLFKEIPFSERYNYFDEMDVIISATSSPHYTITKQKFVENISVTKPRVLIDLAVPMDIEKTLKDIDGIVCYHIDDFERISKENNSKKKQEVLAADLILEDYEEKFEQWCIFKQYGDTMNRICHFIEIESKAKGIEHAVKKLFYQVRDSAKPEHLEAFFAALKERNEQWED